MANIPKVWNGTAFVELEAAATVPPAASTTVVGIVQLTDSTSSTSTTTAATPNSVKSAYDLAGSANTTAGTAIPKNTVTAAGDILYASGSATVARLGIGTASQVLSVSAGVPAWTTPAAGGGLTPLGTATLSSATGVQFASIPGGYKHLLVRWEGLWASSSTGVFQVRLNNDSGNNYHWRRTVLDNALLSQTAVNNSGFFGGTGGSEAVVPQMITSGTSFFSLGQGWLTIYDYTSTSKIFPISTTASGRYSTDVARTWYDGYYSVSGTAITQIDFIRSSTQTVNGTFFLYGVS